MRGYDVSESPHLTPLSAWWHCLMSLFGKIGHYGTWCTYPKRQFLFQPQPLQGASQPSEGGPEAWVSSESLEMELGKMEGALAFLSGSYDGEPLESHYRFLRNKAYAPRSLDSGSSVFSTPVGGFSCRRGTAQHEGNECLMGFEA